ncbi:hypothetical protein GTW29_13380 [Streptomyces sp. SID7834]|nr:hypothetical protein [Streptomyces sp. SID7834]MYT57693.1 hypothetical protein [Streptomyces sp. SID7834]
MTTRDPGDLDETDELDPDDMTVDEIAALFEREHTDVELLLLAGAGRPAARRPQPLDLFRPITVLPRIDDYPYPKRGPMTRHRDAMRRHYRTRAALAAAATALGLLALVCGALAMWAPFGVSLIVSVFLTEAAARAGRDYRSAANRAELAERITAVRPETPPVAECCGTWVSSAGLVHARRCEVNRRAA